MKYQYILCKIYYFKSIDFFLYVCLLENKTNQTISNFCHNNPLELFDLTCNNWDQHCKWRIICNLHVKAQSKRLMSINLKYYYEIRMTVFEENKSWHILKMATSEKKQYRINLTASIKMLYGL